jgi:WD40 repeat protein
LTPDGKRAVSACWDDTLKVWDLETGRALRTLATHAVQGLDCGDREERTLDRQLYSVTGVAVTPDGKRAVSLYAGDTLKVWDLEGGRALRTLEGRSESFCGVAMTPDGKRAVSASVGRTLKVWDLETGRALRTLEGHSDFVRGVAVTPDGKRAVSASGSPVPFNGETLANDDTLKVWDLDTPVWAWPWRLIRGRALRTLEGHSGGVNGVAVTPDGKRAVSASDDETVKVWDLETGRELRTLEGHSRSVRSVAVTPDGKRAVSASVDKTLKVWNLETGLCIATFHCDAPAWCCACAAPNRIVAGDAGGRVYFLALEE